MEVSNEVKDFIFNHEKEIDSDDFVRVYNLANEYLGPLMIGKLTDIFYKAEIDPLVGMTEIPRYFLSSQDNLKVFHIPKTIRRINDYAFYNCSSLTSVTIGNSVTSIGNDAFYNCSSLTSITIPDSVTSIGNWAFEGCTSLTSITIPDSVTSIGSYAFRGCSSLTSVTIGNSVTSIGNWAFCGCSSLTSINVGTDNSTYKSIDGSLYSKNGKTLIQYALSKTEKSFTIPDSVTSIGEYAFSDCSSLTSITIPDSVTGIGYDAFYGCINLKTIYCEAEVQPRGWNITWNSGCSAKVVWGYKIK